MTLPLKPFVMPTPAAKDTDKGRILCIEYDLNSDWAMSKQEVAQRFWAMFILHRHHGFGDMWSLDNEVLVSFAGDEQDCSFRSILMLELTLQDRWDELEESSWGDLVDSGLIRWDMWEQWTGVELRQLRN
jgi:hypothetical protein